MLRTRTTGHDGGRRGAMSTWKRIIFNVCSGHSHIEKFPLIWSHHICDTFPSHPPLVSFTFNQYFTFAFADGRHRSIKHLFFIVFSFFVDAHIITFRIYVCPVEMGGGWNARWGGILLHVYSTSSVDFYPVFFHVNVYALQPCFAFFFVFNL